MSDTKRSDDNAYVLTPVNLTISTVDYVDLVLHLLKKRWWHLIAGALFGAAMGATYAFLAQPIYRSEVVLAPAASDSSQSGLNSLVSQFGSLANFAGLSGQTGANAQEALAVLDSVGFTSDFIATRDLLPILFSDDWNKTRKAWNSVDPSKIPSMGDGVRMIRDHVRTIVVDNVSGIVKLRIEWTDPVLAASWANDMAKSLNKMMRDRASEDATKYVQYLEAEIARTASVELKEALFNILEEQEKRRTLAAVQEDFAFRVLDAARPSDPRDIQRPKRLLTILIAGICGLFLTLIVTFLLEAISRRRHPSGPVTS